MIRSLHLAVTISAGGAVLIVILTGAVHLVNGSPSGLLARVVLVYCTQIGGLSTANIDSQLEKQCPLIPILIRTFLGCFVPKFGLLISLTAAREMFGKSYYSLSVVEKQAVDQAALNQIGANYAAMTPEYLKGSEAPKPVGFQADAPA